MIRQYQIEVVLALGDIGLVNATIDGQVIAESFRYIEVEINKVILHIGPEADVTGRLLRGAAVEIQEQLERKFEADMANGGDDDFRERDVA